MTSDEHNEERVRAAVADRIRHLEAPDRHRLARIEQRLLEQGRRRRHHGSLWWAVLGLVAAGGAAAYWATGTDVADSPQPPAAPLEEGSSSDSKPSVGDARADGERDGEKARGEQGENADPVIYIGQ